MSIIRRLSVPTACLLLFCFLFGCASGSSPAPFLPDAPILEQNTETFAETSPEIDINLTPYTFVWMSDTQHYSQRKPQIYMSMTNWIVDNADEMNIRYVFHTGDVVHRREEKEQWINADAAMQVLDGVIPYSILAGNHDVGWRGEEYGTYLQYFGKDRFKDSENTRVYYMDGRATAEFLTVGKTKYLLIALGYHLKTPSLYQWANELLANNRDCIAILSTHEYLQEDGSRSDIGEILFQNVVKCNPNVRMVLCGHNHTALRTQTSVDDDGDGQPDRNVIEMLVDYQTQDNGGNGFMRLLTVCESTRTLKVQTYSPYLDRYECLTDTPDQDTFTLSIAEWFQ